MSKKKVKMKAILSVNGKPAIDWASVNQAYNYLEAIRENQIVNEMIPKTMARRLEYWITLLYRIPYNNSIKLDEQTELSMEVL